VIHVRQQVESLDRAAKRVPTLAGIRMPVVRCVRACVRYFYDRDTNGLSF
jgi:hypothetical protein